MLIRGYFFFLPPPPTPAFAGESRSLVGLHGPRLHPAQQGDGSRGEGLPDCQSHCPAQPPCRDAAGAAQAHLCQRLRQTGTDPAALPTLPRAQIPSSLPTPQPGWKRRIFELPGRCPGVPCVVDDDTAWFFLRRLNMRNLFFSLNPQVLSHWRNKKSEFLVSSEFVFRIKELLFLYIKFTHCC